MLIALTPTFRYRSARANVRPELLEQLIEHHYSTVEMPPARVARGKAAIRALVAVSQDATRQVRRTKTSLIAKLETLQDELIEMRFTEKSITPSLSSARRPSSRPN